MAEITIGVIDPTETEKLTIRVPDDIPVGQLTDAMVENMKLPPFSLQEIRSHYRLCRDKNPDSGDLPDFFNEQDTLAGIGIVEGDILFLCVENRLSSLENKVSEATNDVQRATENVYKLEENTSELQDVVKNLPKRIDGMNKILSELKDTYDNQIDDLKNKIDDQNQLLRDLGDRIKLAQTLTSSTKIDKVDEFFERPIDLRLPFRDFELEMHGDGSNYQITSNWIDSRGKHHNTTQCTISESLSGKIEDYFKDLKRLPLDRRKIYQKTIGRELFDIVFGGRVGVSFQDFQQNSPNNLCHIRIMLNLLGAKQLVDLPWEFLCNEENQFLARTDQLSIVRHFPLNGSISNLDIKTPLNMLVITANPIEYPSLDIQNEMKNLSTALDRLMTKGILHIKWLEHATRKKLRQAFEDSREWHIIHYIGHGEFKNGEGCLVLENEMKEADTVNAERLASLLRVCPQTKLVVLNTCQSGSGSTNRTPFAHIASHLAANRISNVVAMQHEIRDLTSIHFARAFYSYLETGYSIYAAMAKTRMYLYFEKDEDVEWATPVLYSCSSDGIIFKPDAIAE